MHLVAGGTRDLVSRVAAFQSANVGGLVQMARQADFVRCGSSKFAGVPNVVRRWAFGVCLSGPVAGFAGLPLPSTFRVRFHTVMGTLGERIIDIFVADLTCVGACIGGSLRSLRRGGLRRCWRRLFRNLRGLRGGPLWNSRAKNETEHYYVPSHHGIDLREEVRVTPPPISFHFVCILSTSNCAPDA